MSVSGPSAAKQGIDGFVTIDRRIIRNRSRTLQDRRSRSLSRDRSGSSDDLYTGTRVSRVPEAFPIKIGPLNTVNEIIGLDIDEARQSVEHMNLGLVEKPALSKKAQSRLSRKKRHGEDLTEKKPAMRKRASSSPARDLIDGRTSPLANGGPSSFTPVPTIRTSGTPSLLGSGGRDEQLAAYRTPTSHPVLPSLLVPSSNAERDSMVSTDSGLGDDQSSQNDRETVSPSLLLMPSSLGSTTENLHTATTLDHRLHSEPVGGSLSKAFLRPSGAMTGFNSLRTAPRHHHKSMLLSELCVVTVASSAEIVQGQKGRGVLLKFRFSPYTQIEYLRVAILKVGFNVGGVDGLPLNAGEFFSCDVAFTVMLIACQSVLHILLCM